MNDQPHDPNDGRAKWRRLAWAVALLPILAGPLGCQTASGGQRIRMPILTGPDLAPPAAHGRWTLPEGVRVDTHFQPAAFLGEAPKDDKTGPNPPPPGAGKNAPLPSGASVPGGGEGPVVPPPVAEDCIDLATAVSNRPGWRTRRSGWPRRPSAPASPSSSRRGRCCCRL